jgi:DNA-binding PadR family transcriptional regulator
VSISRYPAPPRHSALSPEYALLGFLSQNTAHGYDLHQQLSTHLGQIWHVSLSQTYNILNRLEARGFIAGTVQAQHKLPARRRFRLTPSGRRRFDSWLHSTSSCSVRAIRVEFTTRLYFCQTLEPAHRRGLVETQIAKTRACLAHLQAMLDDLPDDQLFNRMGLELRIRQLGSVIEWLEECGAALGVDLRS